MRNNNFSRLLIVVTTILLFSALLFTAHNGQASGSTATVREVDDGNVGVGTAVAVNSIGEVVIAYFDVANLALKVAVCEDKNCYSPDIETVDDNGDVGVSPAVVITEDDRPVISYFDIANGDLKLALCDDPRCTSANIQVIDGGGGTVGLSSDIALDNGGRPVISYYDVNNQQLKIAYCNNPACTAPNLVVADSANTPGLFSSLVIDEDGLAVIAYHESTNEDLKIAFCNDDACSAPAIKTLDAANETGRYPSLTIISGRVFVSYIQTTPANDELKIARCDDFDCNSVTIIPLIEMEAANYSSMVMNDQGQLFVSFLDAAAGDLIVAACIIDPAVQCNGATFTRVDRFHFTGLHTAITLDHEGTPIISYHDQEELALNLASCPLCRVPVRNNIGPSAAHDSISLAMTEIGYPIMTYQDGNDNNFYLVYCQDTVCDSFEKTAIGTNLHINPSMQLQENGRPAIAYYHASTNELKYTACHNDDCTDRTTNVIAFDGYDPTLRLNSSGRPVISFYDEGSDDLVLARCNEITCSAPVLSIVDSAGSVGSHTSMTLTADDYPIISYYDQGNDTIKFAICDDPGCTTPTIKNAQSTDGPYSALALSESGRLYIAFYNNGAQILSTLECNLPCDSFGIGTLDNTAVDVGWDISIVLGENDRPLISYYDVENSALRLATCIQYACSLGATLGVVDTFGGISITGRYSQIALNGRNQPVIAYANLTMPAARILVYDAEPTLYQVYAPVTLK